MKLKYYLRGLGIGILVTAVIMGVTQGSRKETLSDREIRERAAALGMVEPGNGRNTSSNRDTGGNRNTGSNRDTGSGRNTSSNRDTGSGRNTGSNGSTGSDRDTGGDGQTDTEACRGRGRKLLYI